MVYSREESSSRIVVKKAIAVKKRIVIMTDNLLFQSQMSERNSLLCGGELNKTSTLNNGPSEKQTTSLQRTAHLPPIDFTIELIHYEPPRSGHLSTPNNGH